jgi:diguanylate cyclase
VHLSRKLILRASALALLFCINSLLVIDVSRYSAGVAAIWSANAFLVFALMISPRRHHWAYLLGALITGLATNFWAGFGISTAISFSVANIVEAWLVDRLVTWRVSRKNILATPAGLAWFALVAIMVPVVSASVAATGLHGAVLHEWRAWLYSDILGLLVVVPTLLVLRQHARGEGAQISWRRCAELAAILSIVLMTVLTIFLMPPAPLLFLIALPLLVAVFRFGAVGAVAATAIIAVASVSCTLFGLGPIAAWSPDPLIRIYLLQAFLAAELLIALPIAALLADRDRTAAHLLAQERKVRLLAETARRSAELNARQAALVSATDELTGLASRKRIFQKLHSAVHFANARGTPLWVALFDVDNFKAVNDGYGHAIGDAVLRTIGHNVITFLPRHIMAGRVGGEEFLVVMQSVTRADALKTAADLRKMLASIDYPALRSPVTISIGVAGGIGDHDAERLFSAADAALYSAKRAGRNRLEMAA